MSKQLLVLLVLLVVGYAANAGYQATGNLVIPQTARIDHICSIGFYWTGQACLSCLTVANGYCKCASFGACDSVVCDSSYVNIGDTTTPRCEQACDQNCLKCIVQEQAEQCTSCATGYQLVGGICLPLQLCKSLSPDTGICNACGNGYYNNLNLKSGSGGICSPCMSKCSICGSGNTCQTCNSGYFWSVNSLGGACTSCSALCTDCTSLNQCNTCSPASFKTTTNAVVQHHQNSQTTCTPCSAGCTTCTSTTVCTACTKGFGLVSAACQACGTGCSDCTSPTQCKTCNSGYLLNTDGSCLTCPSNCATCSLSAGAAVCAACIDTYYLQSPTQCSTCSSSNINWLRCAGPTDSPKQDPLQPTQCLGTNWLVPLPSSSSASTATATTYQCTSFASSNTCLNILPTGSSDCAGCFPGYSLYQGKCYQCAAPCKTCDTTVPTGATAMSCKECSQGFYLGDTKQCSACGTGCISCTNANTCSACMSSYYLSKTSCSPCTVPNCKQCDSTGACMSCMDRFYLSVATTGTTKKYQCNQCSVDCATCTGPIGCVSCPAKSILKSTGCLKVQDTGCVLIDSTKSECSLCDYGYYLNGIQCLQCIDQKAGYVCRNNTQSASAGSTPSTKTSDAGYGGLISLSIVVVFAVLQ